MYILVVDLGDVHPTDQQTYQNVSRPARDETRKTTQSLKIYKRSRPPLAGSLSLQQYSVQRYTYTSHCFPAETRTVNFSVDLLLSVFAVSVAYPKRVKKHHREIRLGTRGHRGLCTFLFFLFQCLFLIYLMLSLSILFAFS